MFADRQLPLLLLGTLLWLTTTCVWAGTPHIESWQTTKGARVLFVAAHELPMVDVEVIFDAGSARDGQQSGLASLTAGMLTDGAGSWDADAIANRLDQIGASIDASTSRDMTAVSLRTLTQQPAMDTAIDTLATVLTAPSFPRDSFERRQRNRLTALQQEKESPSSVARRAIFQAIFGTHPYARDPSGNETTIAALTRDDLVRFYQRYYNTSNATVAIVGDLDRKAAQELSERILKDLPQGKPAPALPAVTDLKGASSQTIAFPSTQTTVLVGQPGMRRGDPDYFPLYVGNHILGGSGLVSLLMQEIREQRGLSYNTFSAFVPLARPGPFLLGLQTRNDQAAEALQVLRQTLQRFIQDGPTEEELAAARKNITGGFPLRIASNSDVVNYLAVIGFYHLPLDYLDRFNARVEAVTREQIRDAFARRVHPQRMATVIVGKQEQQGQETPAGSTDAGRSE